MLINTTTAFKSYNNHVINTNAYSITGGYAVSTINDYPASRRINIVITQLGNIFKSSYNGPWYYFESYYVY